MKKNIKFLFVFTIFLILMINTCCFAINMNLDLNNTTENTESAVSTNVDNTQNNDSIDSLFVQNNENNNIEETSDPSNAPSVVTTTTSNSNSFLTIDNIIAIILIAIGIVLILFGIAIFVRFK